MSLVEMSVAGAVLILVVLALRAFALHRLPKAAFVALWLLVATRLLVPWDVPSPISVYRLFGSDGGSEATIAAPSAPGDLAAEGTGGVLQMAAAVPEDAVAEEPAVQEDASLPSPSEVLPWIWLAGVLACAGGFLLAGLRSRRRFSMSAPAECLSARAWVDGQRLRRHVRLRSGQVDAPLTYGVLRPVILLPESADWTDEASMRCVLEHEMAHVRHWDAFWKLVLVTVACVHWFNPLAWLMLAFANRDIELRCDEAVVRRLGLEHRGGYARTLIGMEARKSGLVGPFASAFSKSAAEERIRAIMKLRKRSLPAVVAAVVLVACVGLVFGCSPTQRRMEGGPGSAIEALPGFTEEESGQLLDLWVDGYEDMPVAEYRQKMRDGRGDGPVMDLVERYSRSGVSWEMPAGGAADALEAFSRYFFHVYEPLTADQWLVRTFDGSASNGERYAFTLSIRDPETLTVGQYEEIRDAAESALRAAADSGAAQEAVEGLGTDSLDVELADWTALPDAGQADADLHAASSIQSDAQWADALAPYEPFGLTYEFRDPDLDGNGLTMWYEGREVRGVFDEEQGVWITEHTGDTSYPVGAVELHAVYEDGALSGLRLATAAEQAEWDAMRRDSAAASYAVEEPQAPMGPSTETRELPRARQEDYESLLSLMTQDYGSLRLEEFNQRLLDWTNRNPDACGRIDCDVLWDDYGVDLDPEARSFAATTCRFSGTENGMRVRALSTGQEEVDPGWSASLPERHVEQDGVWSAWCDLSYTMSYHVGDRSAVTVAERDAAVRQMMDSVGAFWEDTPLDELCAMSTEDLVSRLNAWAHEAGTNGVRFHEVTLDNVSFEAYDERGLGQPGS